MVLSKAVSYANKEKNYLDNAWYYLRDAEHYIDFGKFEMDIVNMATMLEFVIKFQLKGYLNRNGYYKLKTHKDNVCNLYGGRPSFTNRYFRYGLGLITDKTLDENMLNTIDLIYTARDKIAHGKRIHETKIILSKKIEAPDYRDTLMDLYENCIDVYNFFCDLDLELKA